MDIFFYEAFAEEERALRRNLPPGLDAGFSRYTIQESGHEAPPSGFISIRTQSVIPGSWADSLGAILTRSTGFDHIISFRTATGARITAGYLPLYCSRAVAEQALLLWLGLMRRLRVQMDHMACFDRDGLTGNECAGRTLVVVGVGNIGIEVCRIGEALGMRVIGVDIVERHAAVRYASIDAALPEADIIVCAMNLTDRNTGYFSYDLLKAAKPGSIFVNIARGEVAQAPDLLRLLHEGHLAGVGLDVYEHEGEFATALRSGKGPLDTSMRALLELARHHHAILTPHNAFNTVESVERKSLQSMQQAEHFLKHGDFIWKVPE